MDVPPSKKLTANAVRFRVDPRDVPPEKVARRLHLTLEQFRHVEPNLRKRGFPPPDPDTGMYDLDAVDRWRELRHQLPPGLTPPAASIQHADDTPSSSMAERFVAAKERQTKNGRRHRGPS
jgi:hypothetical protein